jgi:hypothetical protein
VRDPARQRPASRDRPTNEHEADLGSSRYTKARLDRLGQDGSPRAQRRSKADLAEAEPARMKEVASVAAGESRQARNDDGRGVMWRLFRRCRAHKRWRHPRTGPSTLVLGRRTPPRVPGAKHDEYRHDDLRVRAHAPSSRRHIDRARLRSRDKLGQLRRADDRVLARVFVGLPLVHGLGRTERADHCWPGGPASTVGTYSSSWILPSNVRLATISSPTSGYPS